MKPVIGTVVTGQQIAPGKSAYTTSTSTIPASPRVSTVRRVARALLLWLCVTGLAFSTACSRERYTELMKAARDGANKAVTRALDAGVNVNEQTSQGKTALMLAASKGHADTAKLLLDRGADVKLQDSYGTSALIVAATAGESDTVKLLLQYGADPLRKDSSGGSALTNATFFGHADTVKVLLDSVKELPKDDGKELMMLAAGFGHVAVAKELLARGVSANAAGAKGHTALMAAIQFDKPAMVKLLMAHGADPNQKDDEGGSALSLAKDKGDKALLKLLGSSPHADK